MGLSSRIVSTLPKLARLVIILIILSATSTCEYLQEFEISEGVGIGTTIGLIGQSTPGQSKPPPPPYLIVPVPGSAVDSDLHIDQSTGEIRTSVLLDREERSYYSFVAIPLSGENIRVVIKVEDENDNAPEFPTPFMAIEFPENTPRDVKRTLNPARDKDLGIFNTQRYKIVSGNVNNAFRLSSHRERDDVLYLDLQINGFLDRETTFFYSLVIEAYDGGTPPMKGSMTVNITIQDVNDNQPIFNQSRYFATVAENATIGTSVLKVFATDTDSGDNGRISYSINRRQSDRENVFSIDPKTGVISVNKLLDFEAKDVHELVIVARDNGAQPLETTAFVSMRVTDVNDNQPTINLIFLSDDASPKISEDAKPGEFVARISVNDPDSKEEYANVNVTLQGGDGHFGLTTQDNIIYLVIVSHPLDREEKPNYTMVVTATDQGSPPLNASRTFELSVTDTNDNAPEFDHTVYYANVLEVADPGTSVFQLSAVDRDEGNNSVVTYAIKDTPETHSEWFVIDTKTGLVTTRMHIDCETDPIPQITVVATDAGNPPLSSSATVVVTISDVNDNEPIFDQSFYNVTISENEVVGKCVIRVSATDPDCGVNAMVNYTMGGGRGTPFSKDFTIQPLSGELCIASELDHERRTSYEIPVQATDRGGLSTTAMIKVQVIDANDNVPVFYPREYNVSLKEGVTSSNAVIVVVATDEDSGVYGTITYSIVSGNDESLFRIDLHSGEIFVARRLISNMALHHLMILAEDGGGLTSESAAHVYVSILTSNQQPPIFEKARYRFSVREDVPPQTVVGAVTASSSDPGSSNVRYAIYSGDPNGYFSIHPSTGTIMTRNSLDHESHPYLLLNVQAISGHPPSYGHTQVNITIWDVNDNAPEFGSVSLKISVAENTEARVPIYVVHAEDPDTGRNGAIVYELLENPVKKFAIDDKLGTITLREKLDYENQQSYQLLVNARDGGVPIQSSNLTLFVEVQDINDNPPLFDKPEYRVEISESTVVNTQFLQVTATDKDTGNNARLTYKITASDHPNVFGVFPNSGVFYLKETLDRETLDRYILSITAMDNGTPHLSATTSVVIQVLDDNDNDPKFAEEVFKFQVDENKEKGFKIGTLTAIDKDLGNNGSLRYSLVQKQNNGSFSVNPVNGDILTLGALDRERTPVLKLSAVVHDQGSPPRSHTTSVQVTLIDVNDNPPIFVEPSEVSVMVKEEQPIGTEVVQAQAMDADEGKNAQISYAILPTNDTDGSDGSSVFLINSITGMITTKKMLDREQQQLYTIIIQANDGGNPTLTAVLRLQVLVLDVNDNQPAFPTSNLSFRLKEGVPIGHQVGIVQAIDRDNGDNGYVTYSITGGNVYGLFDIGRTTGVVFTIAEVDYETASEHVLQVEAVDSSATNPQSNMVNVKIEIEDLNDCTPSFKTDPVIFSISESVPVDSVVWNFTAVDRDSGPNGEIVYRISQQSPANAFNIEEKSGVLRVSGTVDYETFPEYTIVVTASDQAQDEDDRLEASVTCRVIIEDENDNGPVFKSRTTINVIEDEPVGFPLLHVIAVDEDSRDNGRVTYVINKGNEKGHFALDYDSGLLSIARSLDREDTHHYILNITASDHGKPTQSAYQLIHIYVEDVNDNPPHFEQAIYFSSLSEAAQIGTFVTKVRANDKDVGASGNLTYVIPNGVADNRFTISARTGEIRTAGPLDREEKSSYIITVYVRDGAFPAHYDTSTVVVDLLDVNDHAPDFGDSCYPLHVPENSELGIIHTVVATDHDTGPNSEITYTITDGNIGSKFSIDLHTGHLSSRPLDREQLAQYQLTITARDLGDPSLVGVCNITVTVLDQNDNDPFFERSEYSVSLPEDTPINTTVLLVQAHDRDDGINSKITYSLNNETQSLFRIDSDTGAITTAGHFDREKRSFYMFEVRATDGGPYDARSERALISITITDVNDNKPIFSHYPFVASVSGHAPPGTQVAQLSADDSDEGPNSSVYFSFSNSPLGSKFHLEPSTGVVTVAGSLLADVGKVFHIDIVARDKGDPYKSSTGVLEITVGEKINVPSLQFDNSTYQVEVPEHSFNGMEVLQVRAHSPGNTAQVVTYNLGGESDDNLFDINSHTGMIFVKNTKKLDYETSPLVTIVVVAQARSSPNPSYGYASVIVNVQDKNDNAPRFSQEKYVSSVWEGNNKGTFVTQVTAMDDDQDGVGNILYHVIEGNHDNAFVIDPPFSGIVKTNIVLDREIREAYTLTIIAVDDGTTQMTGTCTLKISIVDVNDNQPVFPPHSYVSISEGAEVGTVVTTITANDVDTNPTLTYSFTQVGNPGGHFSIDRYSGRITLAQPLDHEVQDKFELQIQASDSAHVAETLLTVHVTDINDNPPVFTQQSYQVTLPELVDPGYAVATVNATDKDSGENAAIFYSMSIAPVDGFYIDSNTGVIFTNASVEYDPKRPIIQLVVTARDKGKPSLASVAAVGIQVVDVNNNPPKFTENKYIAHLSEDAPRGSTVIKVYATDHDESRRNNNIDYSIVSGNVAEAFIITGVTGEIILIKELDREQTAIYNITVLAMDRGSPTLNSTTEVILYVDDINDHPPLFSKTLYESSVSESAIVGSTVLQVAATDMDKNQKAKITYDITSGNGEGRFSIDTESGVLVIDKLLDYEETSEYKFIVRATDNDPQRPLSALSTVVVKVEDENDNAPHFPLQMYTEFVEENAPIGTSVFNAHAIDADRGIYGKVNYSLTEGEGTDKFRIDTETGMVTTAVVFDFESKSRYFFTLMAVDLGNKYATVQVQVDIEGRDEYPPEFTKNNYHFVVPADAPIGMIAGKVQALDKDEGADGRVVYHLKNNEIGFGINATTGSIIVTSPLKKEYSKRRKKRETRDVNLYVIASSGRPTSLTSMSVVGITVDYNLNASIINTPDEKLSASLPAWGLGLMITLAIVAIVLLSLVFLLRLRTKRNAKPPVIQGFDNSFDTIDIRHPPSSSGSLSQFPPHYNDISQFDPTESTRNMNGATSEVSDQSHSASSGRGSAEDGEDVEDEEIRMINEGPLLQQQKLHSLGLTDQDIHHDDDDLSDISVQNTQEYLARLGINPNVQIEPVVRGKATDFRKHPCSQSVESMRMFDEENGRGCEGDGMDISNLIYSKLDEVGDEDNDPMMDGTRAFGFGEEGEPSMTGSLSSIVHSEEELTGSYNWDYLLDWGPQYQPLAHVFAEIARLKDDSLPSTYIAGPLKKMLNPQVKTLPPPLITNVAPRSIAPVALSSGHPSQVPSLPSLPRSPISHDSTFSSPAMSPSFTPSLSPLATRSPSISPMVTPGSGLLGPGAVLGTPHHGRPQRQNVHGAASSGSETELHI